MLCVLILLCRWWELVSVLRFIHMFQNTLFSNSLRIASTKSIKNVQHSKVYLYIIISILCQVAIVWVWRAERCIIQIFLQALDQIWDDMCWRLSMHEASSDISMNGDGSTGMCYLPLCIATMTRATTATFLKRTYWRSSKYMLGATSERTMFQDILRIATIALEKCFFSNYTVEIVDLKSSSSVSNYSPLCSAVTKP